MVLQETGTSSLEISPPSSKAVKVRHRIYSPRSSRPLLISSRCQAFPTWPSILKMEVKKRVFKLHSASDSNHTQMFTPCSQLTCKVIQWTMFSSLNPFQPMLPSTTSMPWMRQSKWAERSLSLVLWYSMAPSPNPAGLMRSYSSDMSRLMMTLKWTHNGSHTCQETLSKAAALSWLVIPTPPGFHGGSEHPSW